jgi:superfamily II RNA helicase
MNGNGPAPALDLHDFRRRAHQIGEARAEARRDSEEAGIAEAEAEHSYRKRKAIRMAHHRNDGKGVTEAEILAEGDVAEHRRERDIQHVLRRAAEQRWHELERNAASLRTEASMSEGL